MLTAVAGPGAGSPKSRLSVSFSKARGHILPSRPGRSHVDGDTRLGHLALQDARDRFNLGAVASALVHQQMGHTPGPVAASLGFTGVGVPDAHEGVGAVGLINSDELIAADTRPPVGDAADGLPAQFVGVRTRVDDDKIVAEPVHLEEVEAAHGRYIGAMMGESPHSAPGK